MKKLPKTPSKLLAIGLADLVKIERSKKYEINMNRWHYPAVGGQKCSVCFAGAVMVKRLEANPYEYLVPSDFEDARKLEAINGLRAGAVEWACQNLGVKNKYKEYVYITPYEESPKQFKADIRTLIKDLQKVRM